MAAPYPWKLSQVVNERHTLRQGEGTSPIGAIDRTARVSIARPCIASAIFCSMLDHGCGLTAARLLTLGRHNKKGPRMGPDPLSCKTAYPLR